MQHKLFVCFLFFLKYSILYEIYLFKLQLTDRSLMPGDVVSSLERGLDKVGYCKSIDVTTSLRIFGFDEVILKRQKWRFGANTGKWSVIFLSFEFYPSPANQKADQNIFLQYTKSEDLVQVLVNDQWIILSFRYYLSPANQSTREVYSLYFIRMENHTVHFALSKDCRQ